MKTNFLYVVIVASFLLPGSIGMANAQSVTPKADDTKSVSAQSQLTVKRIGFRLSDWQIIHDDGSPAARERIDMLQQIGCEMRESNHGNHVDTYFRCLEWNSIALKDDNQVQQWLNWLANQKFETVVVNPGSNIQLPTVRLRMSDWKSMHVRDERQLASLKRTFEMIGCEVSVEDHGNHKDAKIRCQNWVTISLANSQAAHIWQDWLNKTGFETEHDHAHDHDGQQQAASPGHDHSHSGHGHSHDHDH